MNNLPELRPSLPASEAEITNAEKELNLEFADEYREYLLAFGSVWSDIIAISGISDDEDYEVVALTKKLRGFNPHIPLTFYAIEDVGIDGLVIWQDKTGAVYQSIPNQEPVKIFDHLSDFLKHQMVD